MGVLIWTSFNQAFEIRHARHRGHRRGIVHARHRGHRRPIEAIGGGLFTRGIGAIGGRSRSGSPSRVIRPAIGFPHAPRHQDHPGHRMKALFLCTMGIQSLTQQSFSTLIKFSCIFRFIYLFSSQHSHIILIDRDIHTRNFVENSTFEGLSTGYSGLK
jgi:hypothetical protein